MYSVDSEGKPAILCLHGGGTSAAIFNIQTIRLRREMGDAFDFVFIDAPFECGPGPNVLPVFEGAGPFLCWRDPANLKTNQAPEKSVAVIKAAIAAQFAKTKRHFVGVMGFSEGARMAAGVALYQQSLRAEKRAQQGRSEDDETGFLFTVCLCATTPPLTLTPGPSFITSLMAGPTQINLPSLHLAGLQDPWRIDSKKLAGDHFNPRNAKVVEFNIGHHLPTAKADSVKFANEIINLYHRIIDNF